MDPTLPVQAAQAMPEDIMHTMVAATILAGVIRLVIALLKLPMLGQVWKKLPWWAKPLAMVALTGAGFFFDSLVMGQVWYLALGSALTALGGAVVSHEWQDLFRKDRVSKRTKKAPPAEAPAP